MQPKLTLVGAGPGDGELITLKGIRALQKADVVLYDDLANATLLDFAPAHCLKMYVGKRAGKPSKAQDEINTLIVRLATQHGHVVRLKGGDAYVFGRGFEERTYALDHGISCEVIPGVSSSIAVPAAQGIPVTCRGVSESFWVITGTTRSGGMSKDMELAVQSDATVVVLMGLNKLQDICALYVRNGKANLPMAVIQNGTRTGEQCVVGQVWEIPSLVAAQGVGAPAVIVLGEVVALHKAYLPAYLQSLQLACI
ncbi:uroporphyrinogen-III C-methyltransferase [Arsenicibacter rosenii]|uniref:uroporphyrinogen-III C-methyltransferase n=1 Tax=Arsenicibacter rosenii TaxID=1750698 RepID=A0A1S2VPQ0_9BACT|nr:uroporphyrinogen-III C-methyltransferase [Arsenicibacter rosenii]OIN60739.1 uroporphyrinogen-III C-methyltransferase [Arsenicibacter rosenii]